MFRIESVILCIMLFVISCNSGSHKNSFPSNDVVSDSIVAAIENMTCDDYYYEDTIPFALPGESGDCPKNLVTYGDSILISRIELFSSTSDEGAINWNKEINKVFTELQRYKTGIRKYYPREVICKTLSDLQIELTYFISHGGDLNDNTFNVFFRLIEQAVRFCPDINLLSSVCSEDHYLGTLDFFRSYNYIMYYSLIYRKPDGQYGVLSFKGNGSKITNIRIIDNTETYRRYLVSDESYDGYLSCTFKVWVVDLYSDGSTRVIVPSNANTVTSDWVKQTYNSTVHSDTVDYYLNPLYKYSQIVYNPNYIRWSFCNLKNGIFYPVKNSKDIYLDLDDNSANFRIQ